MNSLLIGWIGVPWNPAESVTRGRGDDLATMNITSVPWLEWKAVPPLSQRPVAKLATSHRARRRTRKVFRGLNNLNGGLQRGALLIGSSTLRMTENSVGHCGVH
jgi:hypothetical protein